MIDYNIEINNLSKFFGRRKIFNKINLELNSPDIYGVSGKNGSGKSTFAKILSGLIFPSSGKVIHKRKNEIIAEEKVFEHCGFVAPYLNLYNEFTAYENIVTSLKIRGLHVEKDFINTLFEKFNLIKRKNDFVKAYSSGMLQRLRFIFALSHKPDLLILDEPVSNLDDDGKATVYSVIESFNSDGGLVIIASNEKQDLALCNQIIYIENFKEAQHEN